MAIGGRFAIAILACDFRIPDHPGAVVPCLLPYLVPYVLLLFTRFSFAQTQTTPNAKNPNKRPDPPTPPFAFAFTCTPTKCVYVPAVACGLLLLNC
jgi:hypothetical protein